MKNTKNAALVAIGAAALPLLTAPPVSAISKPGISITIGTISCAAGSMNLLPDSDPGRFRLRFSTWDFAASVGKDVPAEKARKSCTFNLIFHFSVPSTWALESISSRGTADLEPEVTGKVTNEYQVSGTPAHEISHAINAPTRTWQFEDVTPLVFLPCGAERSLILKTQLQVETTDPAKAGSISLDSPDEGATYSIAYKKCPAP
ncbi:DUF4360 domain-containing protein [Actinomadura litoris]|uniref:DUF4360 domain-containing protein n=1 Tax=Actinomadura litoris TaxID=2678616 RepID=A0A7K1KUH8_9ACTN|nr:DUF4360 domain-containing protein [Actinomadura litoris]MUN35838.1 DUF4360 domain-containing protein [Actinomadura litoris]